MEIIKGNIQSINEDGTITILATYENIEKFCHRQYEEVAIGLIDGREITPEQRRKAYALIQDIAAWDGYAPVENEKEIMKYAFNSGRITLGDDEFSLSSCDVTTAREFISFLIEFVVENHIPTRKRLADVCDDISRYVYVCMLNKVCAVCGRRAELHHVSAIGFGRNRNHINHIGIPAMSLCREHHTESHKIGQDSFMRKYHLSPVKIDECIAKKYKLKGETK